MLSIYLWNRTNWVILSVLKNTLVSIFGIYFDVYNILLVLSWVFYSGFLYSIWSCLWLSKVPSRAHLPWGEGLSFGWGLPWDLCAFGGLGFISSFIHIRIIPGDSWSHCVLCPWSTSDPNPDFGSVPGFLAIELCFKVPSSPLMSSVRVLLHACITFVIKALYWLLFHHFIQLWCLPSPFLCTESRARS